MREIPLKPLSNAFRKNLENNKADDDREYPLQGSEGIFVDNSFPGGKTPKIPDAACFKKS